MPVDKLNAGKIFNVLEKLYPDAHCELNFSTPLELLVAAILSAQCTDKRVNEVTPALFKKYRSAKDFSLANDLELQEFIKSTGFFRQKAKSIKNVCQDLVDKYDGEIPKTIEDMVKMKGIGRKTASLVLGCAFGIPAIAVDTHVRRLSLRMGFSKNLYPDKIEEDLKKLFSQDKWIKLSLLLMSHGRRVCSARKPRCEECALSKYCPQIL